METAFEALIRVGFKFKYSLGIESANKVLHGGLTPGDIYEFIGESGIGKTQLLFSIVQQYLTSQPKFGVCWIDLNGAFRSLRFIEFDKDKRVELLDRLFVASVLDAKDLIKKLQFIEENFNDLGIRLLIVDNIGSIMNRTAWTLKADGGNYQKAVFSMFSNLIKKHMTVITSNHTVKVEGQDRPALGRLWSNMITKRILVSEDEKGCFLQQYSANERGAKGHFRISEYGILELDASSMDAF